MSIQSVRRALEVALNGISPSLATAFDNVAFTPTPGTAYQRVNLLPANPENPSIGAGLHREIGVMQVTLCYPINAGAAAAEARAELVRATFTRGASFTSGGVTVRVTGTPAIARGFVDADRYCVPVSIPYHCNVFA